MLRRQIARHEDWAAPWMGRRRIFAYVKTVAALLRQHGDFKAAALIVGKAHRELGIQSKAGFFAGGILWAGGILGFLVLALEFFGIRDFRAVNGQSMEPNFLNRDEVVVLRRKPERFDAVILRSPWKSGETYIKRMIGLPGDRVAMKNGEVYINGEALSMPLHFCQDGCSFPERVVPLAHYFVLGDRRMNSQDSRSFGFVPETDIEGVVGFLFRKFTPVKIK